MPQFSLRSQPAKIKKHSEFLNTNLLLVGAFLFFAIQLPLASAQSTTKIAVKPVEPFFQQVSADAPAVYQPKVTYLSPEKSAPIEFSGVGATWTQSLPEGTSLDLEIRLKSEGKYSDWYLLEPSIDEKDDSSQNGPVSAFLTTNIANGYQYRITLNSQLATVTPVLDNLKFTFINGGSPAQKTSLLVASRETSSIEHSEYLPNNFNAADFQTNLFAPSHRTAEQGTAASPKPSVPFVSTSLLAQAESPTVIPTSVKTVKIPVRAKKSVSPLSNLPVQAGSPVTNSALKIISRADWGADESLRLFHSSESAAEPKLVSFESDYYTKYASELKESLHIDTDANGNKLTWALSYPQSIKKIVIHHTATTKDLDNPKNAIRDIYVWHTLSKGWGDIGYNYIIDPQGNIYEGRYGGEMVVGAHAGRGNFGSIGIALLGNYHDNEPPEAVVTALTSLIKEKARLYNIDTEGASLFRGQNYPNVMGHRDIMSTSCPGDKLFAMFPIIRKLAKVPTSTAVSGQSGVGDFGWQNDAAPVVTIDPKGKKTVTLNIKNTGSKTWSQGTYFQVHSNQNAKTFLRNSEKILTSSIGKDLAPGQSAQIKVLLNATATSGTTLIDLQPVINGAAVGKYLSFGLRITTPTPKSKYNYDLLSVIYSKNTFSRGDLLTVTVKLRNTGTSPWQKSGNNRLTLGADQPRDHQNTLLPKPSNRLATMTEDLVQSGQVATFTFPIKVPPQDGIYKEYFTPVVEGIQWMNNHNSFIQLKVGNSAQLVTPNDEDNGDTSSGSAPSFLKTSSQPSTSATTTTAATPTSTSVNIASTKLDLNTAPRPIRIDSHTAATPPPSPPITLSLSIKELPKSPISPPDKKSHFLSKIANFKLPPALPPTKSPPDLVSSHLQDQF